MGTSLDWFRSEVCAKEAHTHGEAGELDCLLQRAALARAKGHGAAPRQAASREAGPGPTPRRSANAPARTGTFRAQDRAQEDAGLTGAGEGER